MVGGGGREASAGVHLCLASSHEQPGWHRGVQQPAGLGIPQTLLADSRLLSMAFVAYTPAPPTTKCLNSREEGDIWRLEVGNCTQQLWRKLSYMTTNQMMEN